MTLQVDEKPRKLSELIRDAGSTFPGARVKQDDCVPLSDSVYLVRGQMSLKKAIKAFARKVRYPIGDNMSLVQFKRTPRYPCVVTFAYSGDKISALTTHVTEFAHQLTFMVNALSKSDIVASGVFSNHLDILPKPQESKSK